MKTNQDFIRLTKDQPIVNIVSALTDFLWEDFVRDARPIVNYLAEKNNIVELSRIGKELFDLLYNGRATTPVINIDEAEAYFRAKQDGLNPSLPKNYKPENAFWVNLFVEICESPAWSLLSRISAGDQFNSGNNAINIINELAKQIKQQSEALTRLAEKGAELSDIRQQFIEEQAKFNQTGSEEALARAEQLRAKGKKIGKEIEGDAQKAFEAIKHSVSPTMDKVQEECEMTNKALQSLAGDQDGVGRHLNDTEEKRKLAKKLRDHKHLKKVIERLGALKAAWTRRKRERTAQSNYSDIVGAKFSDEIVKAFPSEVALAASDKGKALFALKYAQKTLLTKDFEAKTKELDKGPVILYVDISGSMLGKSEIWSKALAIVVAEECLKQNRQIQIHLFDTRIQKSIKLEPRSNKNPQLLDFVASWVTRGGTNFGVVVDHAVNSTNIKDKADILMITDGQADIGAGFIKRLDEFKRSHGVQWVSFCIGEICSSLKRISDGVYTVEPDEDSINSKLFQTALKMDD